MQNNIVAFNRYGITRTGTGLLGDFGSNDVYGNDFDYSGVAVGAGDIWVEPSFTCPLGGDFHIRPVSSVETPA